MHHRRKLIGNSKVFNFFLLCAINALYFTLCSFKSKFDIQINSYSLLCLINLVCVLWFFSSSLVNAHLHTLENLFWIYQLVFLALTPLSIEWDSTPYFLNQHLKNTERFDVMTLILLCNLLVGICSNLSSKYPQKQNFDFCKLVVRTQFLMKIYYLTAPILITFIGAGYIFRKIRYSEDVKFGPLFYTFEALLYVIPVVLFLSYCLLQEVHPSKSFKNQTVFFAIILLILSNPVANARQISLLVLIPCVYPFLRVSAIRTKIFSILVLVVTLFLSNPYDRYTGKFVGVRFEPLSRLGDYDSYSQLTYVISLGKDGLFKPLRQILGTLLFFIPRDLWPGKPIDTGVLVGMARNLRSVNLSCPWIAEMYANGGVTLVLASSVLFGIGFRKLGQIALPNRFLVEGMLCGVAFIILRGSLLQASGKTLLGILVCLYLLRGLNTNKLTNDE